MPRYEVRFNIPAEVIVRLDAEDEDYAADIAWELANEHTQTIAVESSQGVLATIDMDGHGADEVIDRDAPEAPQAEPEPAEIAVETTIPSGWLYPTVEARKAHWFRIGSERSECGKYGRFKSDHGWKTGDGNPPKDACAPCARKFEASRG